MSRRKGPAKTVPVVGDSLQQRVYRHITNDEAEKLAEHGASYEWIDADHHERGIRVATYTTPLRPPIAITITFSEVLINAGVSNPSEERAAEVHMKVGAYNLINRIPVGLFCPWPQPAYKNFYEPPVRFASTYEKANLSEEMRHWWNQTLGPRVYS